MRIARCLAGFCVVSLVLTVLLSAPGCDSGPAKGTGPTMQDSPPPGPGQMSSGDFNKKKK